MLQGKDGWPEDKRDEALRQGMNPGIFIRQLSLLTVISKTVIERIRREIEQDGRTVPNGS
jgi:hypothetical protein